MIRVIVLALNPGCVGIRSGAAIASGLWQDPRFLHVLARSATRLSLTQGESRNGRFENVQIR